MSVDSVYCKKYYFCCILISRFCNVEISLHFNVTFSAFSQCSTRPLVDKLNFHGRLISFCPTHEIRKNFMDTKI